MKLTRQNILRLIGDEETPLHFAGLLRAFGGRHVRHELKQLVEDMVASGEIVRLRGNSYSMPERTDTIKGTISMHRDGYGFVTPVAGGEDIFIPARMTRGAMHGDQVELLPKRSRMGGSRREGVVTAIVSRAVAKVVGRFEENRRGAIVIPDDIRLNLVVEVPHKFRGKAQDGQQVVVELVSYPTGGRPAEGKVLEVLGWPDDPEV